MTSSPDASGSSPCSAPTTVFVAPGGDDTGAGTERDPLATLRGARDAARRLRGQGLAGPVDVVVQPGVYHMAEPLVLEPQDSGTAAGPTTYRAAPGGGTVLSGGVSVTGWRQSDDGIWAAPVPDGLDFRLLRVGEKWATRARYPNLDPANRYTGGWLFAEADEPVPAPGEPTTRMRYRAGDIPFAYLAGAEIHIFIAWGWVNAIVPLAGIDPDQHHLLFAGEGASQDVRAGNRYFIENVFEALDAPGEWFLGPRGRRQIWLERPARGLGFHHILGVLT